MKLRATVEQPARMARALTRLADALVPAAAAAATEALADELDRSREREALTAPLLRDPRHNRIVADDADSIAREFGTLDRPPAPWLAPVLPAAQSPMRAAARARLREVIARAGKP